MSEMLFRAFNQNTGKMQQVSIICGKAYTVWFGDNDGCSREDHITIEEVYGPVMQQSEFRDKNSKRIYDGDIVKFHGQVGTVVFDAGAFGIVVDDGVNYDKIQEFMYQEECCCGNELECCFNDNFISLWEVYFNLNCDENYLYTVEVIGNIHENEELLNG